VSSDSLNAKKICEKNKVNYLKRNKNLSGDKISDFKLINYCLKGINKIYKKKFKYIIYLQPTSPLRKVKEITKAMKIINSQKKKINAIISISKVDLKNHPLKVFYLNRNNYLNLFSEEGKRIFARQQLKQVYSRNGLFYIFKISSFQNSKNIYFRNSLGFLIYRDIVNIDNYQELLKLKKIIK
jgi:CMP-N-acetylneuraminic acid synthetase